MRFQKNIVEWVSIDWFKHFDMKIAIFSPNWAFLSGAKSMHRYVEEFVNEYCEKEVDYEEAKHYEGDIIVCFNGRPDLVNNCIPKEFKGMSVVHMQDYVFQSEKTLQVLKENEIDYLMCYNNHDRHDPFFRKAYGEYFGKVISVPFGYNDLRFKSETELRSRVNKVVALGSVNPVADPLCIADVKAYADFYKGEEFTHKWRRRLVINTEMLSDEMDSLLPIFPKTKDFDYDIVDTYNSYRMFTSGESIMNYPSVKTFEGMACGSALVCSDHACYKELGLIGGYNCVMYKQYDVFDFKKQVNYYQYHMDDLERIAKMGQKLVEKQYNPKAIAKNLFHELKARL